MTKEPPNPDWKPKVKMVQCECWCGREIVEIPETWVAEGKTESCERPYCNEKET